jgi:hypothetical protein
MVVVMKKQITESQIRRIAAKGDTFIKLGESPEAAIKRMMAARKREMNTIRRSFPKGTALTSTYHYVHAYYAANSLLPHSGTEGVDQLFGALSLEPTTWPDGPEVEFEELA